MKKRKLTHVVVSLVLVVLAAGATSALVMRKAAFVFVSSPAPTQNLLPIQSPVPTSEITLTATESGQTAYDLLTASHQVQSKDYDFGIFIEAIDGVAGDSQHFWALYQNGESATVGASSLNLEPGDVVSFKYETIQ